MSDPHEDLTLRLGDGRTLGYAEYGAANGTPLFVFHGSPGARMQVRLAHAPASARGIRVLAPERPGLGLSTRRPGRAIADWPDDVRELADALGIARFAVIGISGGGPYAAACAWRLPGRITRAGIVSGVAPPDGPHLANGLRRPGRFVFNLVLAKPWLMRCVMALGRPVSRRFPELLFERVRTLAPAVDQPVLHRPEVVASLSASLREAFRTGGQGVADELLLLTRPWTFRPEEIRVPVRLWHGDADGVVPVAMGRYLANAIPDCRAEFIPGGGHYLVFDRIGPFLEAMVE
ncbi:MAG TPA: alpha/beta hydrolase [Geminicoccaceae bacterium]|jgi:pimeloyl-ACP methyl ester carboxylesterase|nr:alpha/beta hydrolase [Geminicoccaceae bacterium]HZA67034.1 alpha/beta hydrolase [Geminicoccaceae bacterium]